MFTLALFRAVAGSACSHYIMLQLSPSSSLRSREDERHWAKTGKERKRNNRQKRLSQNKEKWRNCVNVCSHFHHYKLHLSRVALLTIEYYGSVVCTRLWKWATSHSGLQTSSEDRPWSLVLAWSLRPHVETQQPSSSCCFHFIQFWVKDETATNAQCLDWIPAWELWGNHRVQTVF